MPKTDYVFQIGNEVITGSSYCNEDLADKLDYYFDRLGARRGLLVEEDGTKRDVIWRMTEVMLSLHTPTVEGEHPLDEYLEE